MLLIWESSSFPTKRISIYGIRSSWSKKVSTKTRFSDLFWDSERTFLTSFLNSGSKLESFTLWLLRMDCLTWMWINKILFPDWKLEIGKQLLDILTKVRSIFSDKQYFEIENSSNPSAAKMFKENPDKFLERTLECSKQSKQDFFNLPADCPYRFNKVEKIPQDVR